LSVTEKKFRVMSRLAKDWIERNVTLPRKIASLEREFSNGYLFAVILRQYGLMTEEDADLILDRNDPISSSNNFSVLLKTLKKIGINLKKANIANVSY